MEATEAWLPTNSKFDTNTVMKLPDVSLLSIALSNSILEAIKYWTATKSEGVFQLRKELQSIREEHPDLYDALAKDNPDLIK